MRVKCASLLFNFIIIAATVFTIHMFESLYSYSRYNYDSFFSVYSDNIGKRSQFEELSPILPIDAVYTWVNGSDPNMLLRLRATKNQLIKTGQLLKLNVSGEGKIYSEVHDAITDKTNIKCLLRDCVEMKLVVFERIQKSSSSSPLSKKDVMMAYPETNAAVRFITPSAEKYSNFSDIIIAEIFHDATREAILEKEVHGIQAYQAFLTTTTMLQDALPWSEAIVFSNLQPDFKEEHQISKSLPTDISKALIKIEVHSGEKVAVVNFLEESFAVDTLNYFYQNPAVLGQVQINPAFLLWNLKKIEPDPEWLSASRFADNEELRYSLRSLEKFAPWIRHVFIVTNGQIPAWLDLESPRLTIVTHEQLFPNVEGYLPTFSSPAIESQLHKIPGLSKHFLYFNDDVMLGQPVYPQDFFSHQSGYKIYPGWPVPSCKDDCPNAWLHDGYCDAACNNAECDFDGGDCVNVNAPSGNLQPNSFGGGVAPHLGGADGAQGGWRDRDLGCSYSCSDAWLGDRYCDMACNKRACGFDMGDCGISGLMKLNMYNVDAQRTVSSLNSISFNHPYHEASFAFNLSSYLLVQKRNVSKVYYDKTAYVRAVKFLKGANIVQVVLSRVPLQTSSPNISIHVQLSNSAGGGGTAAPTLLNITTLLYFVETKKNVNLFVNRSAEIDVETIHVVGKNPKVVAIVPAAKANKSSGVRMSQRLDDLNIALLPANVSKALEKFKEWLNEKVVSESVYEEILSDLLAPYLTLLQHQQPHPHRQQRPIKGNGDGPVGESKGEGGKKGAEEKKDVHRGAGVAANRIDVLPPVDEGQSQRAMEIKGEQKQSNRKVEGGQNQEDEALRQQQERQKLDRERIAHHREEGDLDAEKSLGGGSDEKTKKSDELEKAVESFNSRKLQSVNLGPGGDKESQKQNVDGVGAALEVNKNGEVPENEKVPAAQSLEGAGAASKQNSAAAAPVDLTKDAFRDSLRFVNKLYDKAFGSSNQRMVISHMPHFINKDIMLELQARFPEEFEQTARHKLRMGTDMQFAFSYFQYIISVKESSDYLDMFNMFDSDNSGVLSDRELRVLATYIYPTPITLETMNSFESGLRECANSRAQSGIVEEPPRNPETYFSQNMPQVTAMLLFNCRQMLDKITAHFSALPKYKHQVLSDVDSQVMFKMLPTNLSSLIGMLDEVRHNRKKFICLNDNFDHNQQDAPVARAVVQDFYEGLYPLQSQFELPREYRNRFLHLDELKTWQSFRWKLKFWSHILLGVLVVISIGSYIQERVTIVYHKVSGAPPPGVGLLPK